MKKALILLVCILLISCTRREKKGFESAKRLEIGFKEHILSLDPQVGILRPSNIVIGMLYEGLMRVDSEGHIVPALAENYEISEDLKTYTFYLRPCHWSSGDPITAYDVEFSWKRSINPESALSSGYVFYPIKNAAKCLEGKGFLDDVGVKALNDRILVVELEHPAPYFLELTSTSFYFPISKQVAKGNKDWAKQSGDVFVSSGPFRIKSWERDKELVLDRNPYYWNRDDVHLREISLKYLPDEHEQVRQFEKQLIDWIGQPMSPFSIDTTESINEVEYKSSLGLLGYFCNVNCYPLNNKNLRKALGHAINRRIIADYIFCSGSIPAQKIINPLLVQNPYQKDCFQIEHQKAEAQHYLQLALDELRICKEDLPKLVLTYPNTALQSRVAQEIQRQWHSNLGIKVQLNPLDKPRFIDCIIKGNHQIASSMWKGLLMNPIYFLETIGSTLGMNALTEWKDNNYDQIIRELRTELDPKKRDKLLAKAENYLLEQMPIIPICFGSVYYSRNEKLKNVYISPLFRVDFTHAYFEEDHVKRKIQ